MDPSTPHTEFLEQKIYALVEELRPHVDAVTSAGDDGREALSQIGSRVIPRLLGLIHGDPPAAYLPDEEAAFGIDGRTAAERACVEMMCSIRSLEFWMARTYRATGCLDLEQFMYRLEHLVRGDEPDPALFWRPTDVAERVGDEEDARWLARTMRERPRRVDPLMARILDAVQRNPEGLTTEEVTHVVNAEAHDGEDPKLMS